MMTCGASLTERRANLSHPFTVERQREESLTRRRSGGRSPADARRPFISLALRHRSRYCLASAQENSKPGAGERPHRPARKDGRLNPDMDPWMAVLLTRH